MSPPTRASVKHAARAEILEQLVRELGDREYENQIEEQLDEGDAVVLALFSGAKKARAARSIGHGRPDITRPGRRLAEECR